MDARDHHNALGAHLTGGTIVIAFDRANEQWRLRANSFTSVSLDPNVLLFASPSWDGCFPTCPR